MGAESGRVLFDYAPRMFHPLALRPRRLALAATVLALGTSLGAAPGPTSQASPAEVKDRFTIPATDDGLPGAGPLRRYEWFQSLWRERRSAWARTVEQDRHAVVFLGDSITQGWGGGLGAAFPGVKVANRGISGDTTRGVLLRLQDDVLALDPAAVVLLIGTNDLEEGASPDTITGNLRLIVAGLEKHDPRMPIVLCQVFPSSATQKRSAEQIKAVNTLYRAAVKNDKQVLYLETWPLFADPGGESWRKPERVGTHGVAPPQPPVSFRPLGDATAITALMALSVRLSPCCSGSIMRAR
jgi:lysophospholipase L1-like esterase